MLTAAEYTEIMKNKRILEQQRVAVIATGKEAQAVVSTCKAQVADMDLRMLLYTNFLRDSIKEYEDAQSQVEPS